MYREECRGCRQPTMNELKHMVCVTCRFGYKSHINLPNLYKDREAFGMGTINVKPPLRIVSSTVVKYPNTKPTEEKKTGRAVAYTGQGRDFTALLRVAKNCSTPSVD